MNRKCISFILALAMVLELCFAPSFIEPSYAVDSATITAGGITVERSIDTASPANPSVTLTVTNNSGADINVDIADTVDNHFTVDPTYSTDPAKYTVSGVAIANGTSFSAVYIMHPLPAFPGATTVNTNNPATSGVYNAGTATLLVAVPNVVLNNFNPGYRGVITANDSYVYLGNSVDLKNAFTLTAADFDGINNAGADFVFTILDGVTTTTYGAYTIARGNTYAAGAWSWNGLYTADGTMSPTTDQAFRLKVESVIIPGLVGKQDVHGTQSRVIVYEPVFNLNIVATDKAVDAYTTIDAITTCLTHGALEYYWRASDNTTAPALSGPAVEIDMKASHVTGPGVWVTPGAWYRTGLDDADFDVATVTAIVSGSATKTSILLTEGTHYNVTQAHAGDNHDFTLLVTAKVVVDPNTGVWTTNRTNGVDVATTSALFGNLWAGRPTSAAVAPAAYADKVKFVYSSSMGSIESDVPTHPNPALIFSHWTVSDTAIGDYVPANPEKDFIRTYTANYALKKSLDYYDDDAVTTLAATEYYPLNTTQSVLHQNPTKAGFIFLGWGTSSNPAVTTTIANIYMDADKAVYAKWVPSFTLTYNMNGGTPAYPAEEYASGAAATASIVAKGPTKAGNTFKGWFLDAGFTNQVTAGSIVLMTTDRAVYAKWDPNSSGGPPGGPSSSNHTLKYESNGGTKFNNETYPKGTKVPLATINAKTPTRTGYTFGGWYLDEALTKPVNAPITMDKDITVYAKWNAGKVPPTLNGDDHFAYIIGYDTGDVRPLANIPRSEVATIFFRLLKDEIRDGNFTRSNSYKDMDPKAWYNNPISTMSKLGIVSGDPNGKFRPEEPITRAEFATICARFDESTPNQTPIFTDVQSKSDHWAFEYINKAAALGWINGYTDGTFRPDDYITRAEAMTVINRVLQRIPETEDDLLPKMVTWVDNPRGEWYYLAVQEATNSHDFKRKSNGVNETWTKFTEPRDWSTYER